jgi:osmoprotectant transport system substrate-binding protein
MYRRSLTIAGLLVLVTMVLAACANPFAQPQADAPRPTLRVSSKEFTEQYVLGNLYTLLLQDAGYTVNYNPLGGTVENHRALTEGQVDIYPEYTGTALLTILEGEFDPSMSADDVYNQVREGYENQYNLTLLQPTQFNNTYCLTMPRARAEELGVTTLSDLSTAAGDLVFGTTQEFTERPDGLPGLQAHYGGFQFRDVRALDPGLLYTGLREGQIDVTTCFGTDGQIAAYDLYVIEDDRNFWPPYPVAPVIRQQVLEENPDIADTLNRLAPLLDGDTMSQLNWEVAGNQREADEVAREFLEQHGLIGGQQ